jgi:hypothetical protein
MKYERDQAMADLGDQQELCHCSLGKRLRSIGKERYEALAEVKHGPAPDR